jgi:hypothetical protein
MFVVKLNLFLVELELSVAKLKSVVPELELA